MKKVGLRNIKTAIAVFICLLVLTLLKSDRYFYACIAAVISMQSSVYDSFVAGRNRMRGTTIGAVTGITLAYIGQNNIILTTLGVIIVIYLCNIFEFKKSVPIACIVFLAIMTNLDDMTPLVYGTKRLLETFLGIIVSVLVNFFIFPPEVTENLNKKYNIMKEDVNEIFKDVLLIGNNNKLNSFRNNITAFESLFNSFKMEHRHAHKYVSYIEDMDEKIERLKEVNIHLKVIREIEESKKLSFKNKERVNKELKNQVYNLEFEIENKKDIKDDEVLNYHVDKVLDIIKHLK